jgi:hypothetical protein
MELDLADRPFPQRLDPFHGDQPPFPDDAHPVSGLLHLAQDMGGHKDRAPGLLHLAGHGDELPLQERIQPTGGLVKDQQLRRVHERLNEAELLPVPLGQAPDLAAQVQLQAFGQLINAGTSDAAAEVGEIGQQLPAGLAAVDDELAGEVPDPTAQGDAVAPGVDPQDGDAPAGGSDQVQQQPDGGGLAGTVGAQEPIHLAAMHLQIQPGQTAGAAVSLDEPLGGDGQLGHRCFLPSAPLSGSRRPRLAGSPTGPGRRSRPRRRAGPASPTSVSGPSNRKWNSPGIARVGSR